MTSDEAIIDLYWDRNESAIARTQEKYGNYCYSISFNILETAEDSEECVSDTWLRAWNDMPPALRTPKCSGRVQRGWQGTRGSRPAHLIGALIPKSLA